MRGKEDFGGSFATSKLLIPRLQQMAKTTVRISVVRVGLLVQDDETKVLEKSRRKKSRWLE